MYSRNYFDDDTSTVGRRSRRTFSTHLIFIDDVYFLKSDFKFFNDTSRHPANAYNARRYADRPIRRCIINLHRLGRFRYMTVSVQRSGQFQYMMTSVHMRSISVHVFLYYDFCTCEVLFRYIIKSISVHCKRTSVCLFAEGLQCGMDV